MFPNCRPRCALQLLRERVLEYRTRRLARYVGMFETPAEASRPWSNPKDEHKFSSVVGRRSNGAFPVAQSSAVPPDEEDLPYLLYSKHASRWLRRWTGAGWTRYGGRCARVRLLSTGE
ncbi:hypothetical protein DPSP01_009930 [Paraphaeosphaeria sporulosa]